MVIKRTAWAVATLLVTASVPALADVISTSTIDGPSGTLTQTGSDSSAVSDGNGNAISSFYSLSGPVANMGASYTIAQGSTVGSPPGVTISTQSGNNDSWYLTCTSSSPCETVNTSVPISIVLNFSGKLSAATDIWGEDDGRLLMDYSFGDFSFELGIAQGLKSQDDTGPGVSGYASWCEGYSCTGELPIAFALNGDGSYNFSYTYTEASTVCTTGAPCAGTCPSGRSCSPTDIAFVDSQSVFAQASDYYSGFLDVSDPFSVEIISDDPNYQFVSADGRVSGTLASTPVPEPGTLTLFGAALVGLMAMRRRQRKFRGQPHLLTSEWI